MTLRDKMEKRIIFGGYLMFKININVFFGYIIFDFIAIYWGLFGICIFLHKISFDITIKKTIESLSPRFCHQI